MQALNIFSSLQQRHITGEASAAGWIITEVGVDGFPQDLHVSFTTSGHNNHGSWLWKIYINQVPMKIVQTPCDHKSSFLNRSLLNSCNKRHIVAKRPMGHCKNMQVFLFGAGHFWGICGLEMTFKNENTFIIGSSQPKKNLANEMRKHKEKVKCWILNLKIDYNLTYPEIPDIVVGLKGIFWMDDSGMFDPSLPNTFFLGVWTPKMSSWQHLQGSSGVPNTSQISWRILGDSGSLNLVAKMLNFPLSLRPKLWKGDRLS